MPIFIILFFTAFFISSCEMPKNSISLLMTKILKSLTSDDNFEQKENDKSRPSSSQVKTMNSSKQGQDLINLLNKTGQVTSGSPKHPFPSEDPF